MSKLLEEIRELLIREIDGDHFELRASKDETTQRVLNAVWPILDEVPEPEPEESQSVHSFKI